jgi:manganese/iron transport system permease protein
LHQMMLLGAVIGSISSVTGVYISFYVKNVPSGPAIVLVSSSLFVLALLFTRLTDMVQMSRREGG